MSTTSTKPDGEVKEFVLMFDRDIDGMLDDLRSVGVNNARKAFATQLDDMLSKELQLDASHLAVTAVNGDDVVIEVSPAKLTVSNQEKLQGMVSSGEIAFSFDPPGRDTPPIALTVTGFGGEDAADAVAVDATDPTDPSGPEKVTGGDANTVTIVAVVVGSIVILAIVVAVVVVRKRSTAVSFNSFEAADTFSNPIYDTNMHTSQLQDEPSFA